MRNHTPNTLPHLGSGNVAFFSEKGRSFAEQKATLAEALTRDRRGGAVIIVVLALLSLMIFLGVFFFEFVQEEQLAAGNYAANPWDVLNPDRYFDSAEKTIIVGPDATHTLGALSARSQGAYHSMVAHTTGGLNYGTNGQLQPTDVLPHNGHGITTILGDTNGDGMAAPWSDANSDNNFDLSEGDYVLFDMDGDGVGDATLYPMDATDFPTESGLPMFAINYSPPAQLDPSADTFSQTTSLPAYQPDVEYTYPDINNLFLAYDTIDPTTGRRILVPSFHRPDLFSSRRQTGNFSDLYTSAGTMRLVMRPHSGNLHPDGATYIFPNAAFQAQSGNTSRLIQPFPFTVDSDNDGTINEMGIYSAATGGENGYDLDVDLNGDGKPDGIWIHLGHDLVDLPDGRQFVPLYSFYILDGDAQINLNTAGNMQGYFVNGAVYNTPMPTPTPFSVSHTGTSASEINPMRALTGNPLLLSASQLALAQAEHAFSFGFPVNSAQSVSTMANMETAFLTVGRPTSQTGARLTGRYGDENLVGTATYPRPGITGYDDDLDSYLTGNTPGSRYQGGKERTQNLYDPRGNNGTPGTISNLLTPNAGHPIAPLGTGGNVYATTGMTVGQQSVVAAVPGSPVIWPQYPNGFEAFDTLGTTTTSLPPNTVAYPYGLRPHL